MSLFYLIKRGLYYRPDARGYTTDLTDAGTFSQTRADFEVASTHGEVEAIPVPPYLPPIVSAAMLMEDGLIVCGARHFSPDMRAVLHRIYGEGYHLRVAEQGFMDYRGTFLNREVAHLRAKACGQIRHRCGGDEHILYSENLG